MEFYATATRHYLTAVSGSRTTTQERLELIDDRLRSAAALLGVLLRFAALRRELSNALPQWLEIAASSIEGEFPALARELRDTATRERSYRRLLIEDLRELLGLLRAIEATKLLEPPSDPRIERLATARALVPTRTEPWIVIAVELELCECARAFERALLDRAARSLPPGVDARRFLRESVADAEARIAVRRARLGSILCRNPDRISDWANVAATLTRNYLGAIEACVESGLALAEQLRVGPTHSPPRFASPRW